jgi:hypothetical protein
MCVSYVLSKAGLAAYRGPYAALVSGLTVCALTDFVRSRRELRSSGEASQLDVPACTVLADSRHKPTDRMEQACNHGGV